MVEIKRFLDVREDRFDDIRDIEILADKLLRVLYDFEKNEPVVNKIYKEEE